MVLLVLFLKLLNVELYFITYVFSDPFWGFFVVVFVVVGVVVRNPKIPKFWDGV